MVNKENREQRQHINLRRFADGLKTRALLKELGLEPRIHFSMIDEVISNLDRTFSGGFGSREEMEAALDEALSGEGESLTTIKLPSEIKNRLRALLMEKINKQLETS